MSDFLEFITTLDGRLLEIAKDFVDSVWRFFSDLIRRMVEQIKNLWTDLAQNSNSDQRETLATAKFQKGLDQVGGFNAGTLLRRLAKGSGEAVDKTIVDALESFTRPGRSGFTAFAKEMALRVGGYAQGLQLAIASAIRSAFGQNTSPRALEEAILGHLGGFMAKIRRFAATEVVSLGNLRIRHWARSSGLKFVMRLAVMDNKVCQWCAARSGNIYEVDKAPGVVHPNDRCYYLPVNLERARQEDVKGFLRQHREQLKKELGDRNLSFAYGRSPFERMQGLVSAPSPFLSADDLLY